MLAQFSDTPTITVIPDKFVRAETYRYFDSAVTITGRGKFCVNREALPIDNQKVVGANRDTLHSTAVLDIASGTVTFTLPDPGNRFMSLQVITEDPYTPEVIFKPGRYTFTIDEVGTRYVLLGVRKLVDPANREDLKKVHALQDAIKVSQANPDKFEIPDWDSDSREKVRTSLLSLAATVPSSNGAVGANGQVDSVRRLVGAASAWGGNPDKFAVHLNVTQVNSVTARQSIRLSSRRCQSMGSRRSMCSTL